MPFFFTFNYYDCICLFLLQSQQVKPSTLWSKQKYISKQTSPEISNSVEYAPTRLKVIMRQEINTFLINADHEMMRSIY